TNERSARCRGLTSTWGETFWWATCFLLLDHNAGFRKSDRHNRVCRFATCLREYAACCGQKHEQDVFYRGRGRGTRRQRQWRISPLRSPREDGYSRCCTASRSQVARIAIKDSDDAFHGHFHSP